MQEASSVTPFGRSCFLVIPLTARIVGPCWPPLANQGVETDRLAAVLVYIPLLTKTAFETGRAPAAPGYGHSGLEGRDARWGARYEPVDRRAG